MVQKTREIFIKLEKVQEAVNLLSEIKQLEKETKTLFKHYDAISVEENKIFENWNNYIDDLMQKLDHVTL